MRVVRGFTLFEIVVAIGLLLALSLIVMTTFFASSPTTVLMGALEQVAGDIRLARDLSVSEHTRYRLVFSAGSDLYTLQKRNPVSGIWSDAAGTQQVELLPDGVRFQSITDLDAGTLLFDSLGAPYEGSGTGTALSGSGAGGVDHLGLVTDGTGRSAYVTIAPVSGRVDIGP